MPRWSRVEARTTGVAPGRRRPSQIYLPTPRRAAQQDVARSPVGWANHGGLSQFLARAVRPRQPSVLVLSLPRSGSSWVGLMLGSAPDALYLREPVTQSDSTFYQKGTVFPLMDAATAGAYERLADRAFVALPDFTEKVIIAPDQWSLADRRERRLVIKEVNPLACGWYVARYRPRVVFLVRHPAAVAWSAHKQGWLALNPREWAKNGVFQARALREARSALENYADCQIVVYESLAANPLGGFERLFAFAGLNWNDATRRLVEQYSTESARLIDSWRDAVPRACVVAQGERFRSLGLPWYGSEGEW